MHRQWIDCGIQCISISVLSWRFQVISHIFRPHGRTNILFSSHECLVDVWSKSRIFISYFMWDERCTKNLTFIHKAKIKSSKDTAKGNRPDPDQSIFLYMYASTCIKFELVTRYVRPRIESLLIFLDRNLFVLDHVHGEPDRSAHQLTSIWKNQPACCCFHADWEQYK